MAWETWVQSPGRVIPMTQKMVLDASLLRYRSRIKWINPGKGVAPSLTPWCSSYWKGSLQVSLDYGRQLYFTLSTVQWIRTSWALFVRKAALWCNSLLQKLGNSKLCYLAFMLEVPIWRFQCFQWRQILIHIDENQTPSLHHCDGH